LVSLDLGGCLQKIMKSLQPEMRTHYNAIHFKPSEFVDYLLSDQVGFGLCMNMVSTVKAKGARAIRGCQF